MQRFATEAVIAATFLLLAPHGASGDRVTLKSGRVVGGVVEEEDERRVRVRTPQGLVSFNSDIVASVQRDSAERNSTELVRIAIREGKASRAIAILDPQTARESDELLLGARDSVIESAQGSTEAEAARFIASVRDRPTSAPPEIHLLLARYLCARGDTQDAAHEVAAVHAQHFRVSPAAKDDAVAVLRAEIAAALDADDTARAAAAMRLLADAAPEQVRGSERVLLELREVERASDEGRFEDALRLLGESVRAQAPTNAAATAREMLERASLVTSAPKMLEFYATASGHFSRTKTPDAAAIQERHVELLLEAGDLDAARDAADRLSQLDADAGAPSVHRVEFARRKAAIADGDLLAQYKLGAWAVEMGLTREARGQFQLALSVPELRENARLQIDLLDTAARKAELDRVSALLEAGRMNEARAEAQRVRQRHPDTETARQARALIDMAIHQQVMVARSRPRKADALYQNAERLHMQGRDREALEALNRVQLDYAGTPAAKKAGELRRVVTARLGVQNTDPAQAAAKASLEDRASDAQRAAEIRRLTGIVTGNPPPPATPPAPAP